MPKTTSKRPSKKLWGYSYIHEGVPSTITYMDRPWLELDTTLPSQHRKVLALLRVLNASKVKP